MSKESIGYIKNALNRAARAAARAWDGDLTLPPQHRDSFDAYFRRHYPDLALQHLTVLPINNDTQFFLLFATKSPKGWGTLAWAQLAYGIHTASFARGSTITCIEEDQLTLNFAASSVPQDIQNGLAYNAAVNGFYAQFGEEAYSEAIGALYHAVGLDLARP